jgi:hypothetical protein
MYYNSFQSSRAATILYHCKQTAEPMWGRLATCGRLAIGLPAARATLDHRQRRLRLAAMWGRLAGVPSGSGRLAIGLPVARATLDHRLRSLRLAAMRAGWHPARRLPTDCQPPLSPYLAKLHRAAKDNRSLWSRLRLHPRMNRLLFENFSREPARTRRPPYLFR